MFIDFPPIFCLPVLGRTKREFGGFTEAAEHNRVLPQRRAEPDGFFRRDAEDEEAFFRNPASLLRYASTRKDAISQLLQPAAKLPTTLAVFSSR